MKQLVVTCLSDAGGVGKTTILCNIAYECSLRGLSVCLIDLDSNHSLDGFTNLDPEADIELTSCEIFDSKFKGDYPTKSIFGSKSISMIQGSEALESLCRQLVSRSRREYILAKALKKYPMEVELIFLDCAAGFDLLAENALVAADLVILPIDVGVKALTAPNLIQRIWQKIEDLELEPPPHILGLVPNKYNNKSADEQGLIEGIEEISDKLDIQAYPPVRIWQRLKKSAMEGRPLKQLRSNDPMNDIFSQLTDDLLKHF